LKRLVGLATFEVFVWLLLLLCTLLISHAAFGINLGSDTLLERVLTQTVRLAVSGVIILGWLLAWKKATDLYFWRTVSRRKATV
jgi:hypothetical protein